MKYYIRLECKEKKQNICQEVTEEVYNKIDELLLIENKKEGLKE